MFCYACSSSGIDNCPGCVLSPLFSDKNLNDLVELFRLNNDSLDVLRHKVGEIPPCLRNEWVTIKPLRHNRPLSQSTRVCYPCWTVDPSLQCIHCPLDLIFDEKNILDFEIMFVFYGGDLSKLKDEFMSDVTDDQWIEMKKMEISLKIRDLWKKDAGKGKKGESTGISINIKENEKQVMIGGMKNKGKKVDVGEGNEEVGRKGKHKLYFKKDVGGWSISSEYPVEKKDNLLEEKTRLDNKIAEKEEKLHRLQLKISKLKQQRSELGG